VETPDVEKAFYLDGASKPYNQDAKHACLVDSTPASAWTVLVRGGIVA
jgi:hypothetical protein